MDSTVFFAVLFLSIPLGGIVIFILRVIDNVLFDNRVMALIKGLCLNWFDRHFKDLEQQVRQETREAKNNVGWDKYDLINYKND